MSMDYTAYAIIGARIPVERLYRNRVVPNCEHKLPEGAAYCPKCGKPAEKIISDPIYDDSNDRLDGLKIIFGTDNEYAIAAFHYCKADGYSEPGHIGLPHDLSTSYAAIERILRKHELWDNQPIGLWSVLDCSY